MDWPAKLPEFARLIYDRVYPGIRLTLSGRHHAVAYRFDLAPGADPDAIRIRYEGSDDVRTGSGRALLVRASGKSLREHGLSCFQDGTEAQRDVPCSYTVSQVGDGTFEIAFRLGSYDRARSLIIDPEIDWSSYLGGDNQDQARSIAVDPIGNVYVTGNTYSTDFPTMGGFDTSYGGGGGDAFLTKVNAAGSTLAWSSYLGGLGSDFGYGVDVDSIGNAYVTGTTDSPDFPTVGGFSTNLGGPGDAFVTKVTAAGSSLAWSSYLGGGEFDEGRAISVDSNGNVYVTGETYSTDFPTVGGFDSSYSGSDAFVTKVNAAGSSLAWSSYLGGGSYEYGYGIAVDPGGNVYVTGITHSSDFPTVGAFDTDLGGSDDAFAAKVDAAGSSLAWSSYLGGGGIDSGTDIAVDPSGDAYVTGNTGSTDFPIVGGLGGGLGGSYDAFVAKVVGAAGSSLAWSSYLGGSGTDYSYDIAVDLDGNVYVTGVTYSSDFPILSGFGTDTSGSDAFATKVNAAGSTLAWSSYLGGGDGHGVAVDSGSDVYVAGTTGATDFPTIDGFDTTYGGFSDTFVMRITDCGNGVCGRTENECNCGADCSTACGDNCCSGSETGCTCPGDCPAVCGDGCCTGAENKCGCPDDCLTDVCGDSCCSSGETACDCAVDCLPACSDGCCTGAESCSTCRADCGPCADPGPEPIPDLGTGPPPDVDSDPAVDMGAETPPDASLDADAPVDMGVDPPPDTAVADMAGDPDGEQHAPDATRSSMDATADAEADLASMGSGPDGCACQLGRRRGSLPWFTLVGQFVLGLARRRKRACTGACGVRSPKGHASVAKSAVLRFFGDGMHALCG